MRHAQLLGAADPLMCRLVPALVREMGQAYPELVRAEALITETLQARGNPLPQDAGARPRPARRGDRRRWRAATSSPATTAFKLYDTYGFPLDLTQDALRARGIAVDLDGFNAAMERQKAEARAAWAGSGEAATETDLVRARANGSARPSSSATTPRRPKASSWRWSRDGAEVDSAAAGDDGRGRRQPDAVLRRVRRPGRRHRHHRRATASRSRSPTRRRRRDGLFVHIGTVDEGTVKAGDAVELKVDHARRTRAPRQPFGDASAARGAARRARHACRAEGLAGRARAAALRLLAPQADLGRGTASASRTMANAIVVQNAPVDDPADERRRRDRRGRDGAVRREIRRRGPRRLDGHGARTATRPASPIRSSSAAAPMSARTGDIGLFAIVGEGAVAAGVRRIEALTGEAARRHLAEQDRRLKAVAAALKVAPADVPARVEALVEERRRLERELADARKKLALGGGGGGRRRDRERDVAGVKLHRHVGLGRRAEGPEVAGRRRQDVARLRRRRLRRRRRGRQGQRRRRRHRRPDRPLQRRRSGARRRRPRSAARAAAAGPTWPRPAARTRPRPPRRSPRSRRRSAAPEPAGPCRDRRRYVICTSPRSGSTLLCTLLAATGDRRQAGLLFLRRIGRRLAGRAWHRARCVGSSERDVARSSLRRGGCARGATARGLFGLRQQQHGLDLLCEKLAVVEPGEHADSERFRRRFGRRCSSICRGRTSWRRRSSLSEGRAVRPVACRRLTARNWSAWRRIASRVYDFDKLQACVEMMTGYDRNWEAWFRQQAIDPLRISYDAVVGRSGRNPADRARASGSRSLGGRRYRARCQETRRQHQRRLDGALSPGFARPLGMRHRWRRWAEKSPGSLRGLPCSVR